MTKTVFVTISGRTNVGKSSLLNAIVGERIASVSNKPQTTRTRITGIKTVGEIQMVFMDTPGLHKPKNKLSTYMLQAAKEAVNDMDVVLFVADCTRQPTEQELEFLQPLKASKTTVMLVLNKIDLLEEKNVLMQRIAEWNAAFPFAERFPISVSENDGVDLVEEAVCHCAIPAPHYFPDDKITDQPEQVLIARTIPPSGCWRCCGCCGVKCRTALQLQWNDSPNGTTKTYWTLMQPFTVNGNPTRAFSSAKREQC